MKKMKYILIGLGFITYFLVVISLKAWWNSDMHMDINSAIIDKFLSITNTFNKFKGYEFELSKTTYRSTKVTEAGLDNPSYDERYMTSREWIIHGGFSCDEPEAWQALRHFYDPTGKNPGSNKYCLSDFKNIQGYFNPSIDAVSWALEDNQKFDVPFAAPDWLTQEFSFADGKEYLRRALIESDKDFRDKLWGHYWRALGEVLHLFADMGIPCHVRDDGHPPYLGSWDYFWGDPDVMECAVRDVASVNKFTDQATVESIHKSATLREMFDKMATFTNSNFFTSQTIYGNSRLVFGKVNLPKVRPENPYKSPTTDGLAYNEKTFTFMSNINGVDIKMCKDLYYFAKIGSAYRDDKYYVDIECAQSAASLLVPTLISSATEIVKRYIPEIAVELTDIDADKGIISGNVYHKPDDEEYPQKLPINGAVVDIFINGTSRYHAPVIDDKFTIEEAVFFKEDKVVAKFSIGGVYATSQEAGFEMRIISNKGELPPDIDEKDFIVPNAANYGKTLHIEAKWGKDVNLYPDAMYSVIAGFVDDDADFWTLGVYSEQIYKSEPSAHHYFRLDIQVPPIDAKKRKFLKLQMSMRASMDDGRYFLQGRIYKIPIFP
ncbi:MAG: hypothetical protein V1779_06380 [bacterium]